MVTSGRVYASKRRKVPRRRPLPPLQPAELRGLAALVRVVVRREGMAGEVPDGDVDRFALDVAGVILRRRDAGELPRISLHAPTLCERRAGVVPLGAFLGTTIAPMIEGRRADHGATAGALRAGPVVEPATLAVPYRVAMGGW